MELVIMAAGMGSRFGGLKQIEPINNSGEFIIDYSIYDAIKYGFNKVVFIIKEENYDVFRQTIGKRVESKIAVEYVFQKGLDIYPERVKPWGTGHAILACRNVVKGCFATINADDFYGADAFRVVADFLKKTSINETSFALVGYLAKNTLTENGAAKRGVCSVDRSRLTNITESSLEILDKKIYAAPLSSQDNDKKEIADDTIVSMNMFGFTPKIFEFLQEEMEEFLTKNSNNLDKCEYLIPEVVSALIHKKVAVLEVLKTSAVWQGITYKDDKNRVVEEIRSLVLEGIYPQNLWK